MNRLVFRLIFFVFIFLCNFLLLKSQEIVVSEYFNASSPNEEWTELLVIADNLNLTGYVLRDNSSSSALSSWQGGVRFNDHPLWQHLRSGTVIVIKHRGSEESDANDADGYIEIGAENSLYFEKVVYCDGCSLNNWPIVALNISQSAEIVQIINAQGEHVHCLAHFTNEVDEWSDLPSTKVAHAGSIAGNSSVSVAPGANLNSYSAGASNEQVYNSSEEVTKGKPNTRPNALTENETFWRETRQPLWLNPTASADISSNSIKISWSQAQNPYPNDNKQGYIVTRCPVEGLPNAASPVDGRIYNDGEMLGSATILTHSSDLSFTDNYSLSCGEAFVYRVFAYRYSNDSSGGELAPSLTKGRSYNETSYAEVVAAKSNPVAPILSTENNRTAICKGDSIVLSVASEEGIVEYELYLFAYFVESSSENRFVVSNAGHYSVKVIDSAGCSALSNVISIAIIEYPIAQIELNSVILTENQTVSVCETETLELFAYGGGSYEWYWNDEFLNTNRQSILISEEGKYYCIVYNENLCSDTTYSVELKHKKEDFDIEPSILYFSLGASEISAKKSFSIHNNSADSLFLQVAKSADNPFNLTFEQPVKIPPQKALDLEISFEADYSGVFSDYIILQSYCGRADTVFLEGEKSNRKLNFSNNSLDFDLLLTCDTIGAVKSLFLVNPSNEKASINEASVAAPFELIEPKIPFELNANDSVSLKVRFASQVEGTFQRNLTLFYRTGNALDSIKLALTGQAIEPKFAIQPDTLFIPTILEGVDSFDTTFTIKNISNVAIAVDLQTNQPELFLSELPLILDPEEEKEINLRVSPSENAEFSFLVLFEEGLCDAIEQLYIYGKKERASFYFSADTLDFGTHTRCTEDISTTEKVLLYKISSSNSLKISDYEISAPFSFLSKIGEELSDSTLLEIGFNPDGDGEYFGRLTLRFEPTNQEIELFLKGKQNSISVDYENELGFGFITSRDSSLLDYVLINTSDFPISINDYSISNPAFTLLNDTLFPALLGVDSMLVFQLKYKNDKDAQDSADFKLHIASPCDTFLLSKLFGNCVFFKPFVFEISLPELASEANIEIQVPIQVFSKDSARHIRDAYIDGFSCEIQFDPALLYPMEANFSEANFINGVIKEFNEYIPGFLKIDAEISEARLLEEGDFILVKFKTLLGNKHNSDLILASTELTSKNLNVNTENVNGKYKLISDYLSRTNDSLSIEIIGNQPIEKEVQLLCNIVSDDMSELFIINQFGQKTNLLIDKSISPGKYYFSINPNSFGTGVYFVVLKNGNLTKMISILIVK